jgi:hypothetical protein
MSAGQAVEHLLEQRERYGFSYIPVYGGRKWRTLLRWSLDWLENDQIVLMNLRKEVLPWQQKRRR